MVIFLYLLVCLIGLILFIFLLKTIQFVLGKKRIHKKYPNHYNVRVQNLGYVKKINITPIVDFYAKDDSYQTEPGVSYWIEADDTVILLDVGFNKSRKHPSPLVHNLNLMGKSLEDLDMIFFSHLHLDHVGGMREQRKKEFSFSANQVSLPKIPVYSPEPIRPSSNNPADDSYQNIVLSEPTKIKEGIASSGVVGRYFVLGETLEHSLVFNVQGKGLIIVVGCGHQTIEKILKMAQENFSETVYAIVGGLHYPVKNGRIMEGPFILQGIAATEKSPMRGITEDQLNHAINSITQHKVQLLALSAHDSSDYAMEKFSMEMKSAYISLRVGETVQI